MLQIFSYLAIFISINISVIQCLSEMSINIIGGHMIDINWQDSNDIHFCRLFVVPRWSRDMAKTKEISLKNNHTVPVRVDGLTPGYSYNIRLITNGSSIKFKYKTITTKPNRPKNLICGYYSEQTIQVIWEVPETPTMFDEYWVGITKIVSPKAVQKSITTNIFNDLTPGMVYNITVQTKSGNQLSEQLIKECQTIPASPASVWYDQNTLTSNSFDIHWTVPYEKSVFDSYLIIKNEKLQIYYISRSSLEEFRSWKFTEDIKPGKTYKIEVTTRSGKISSKPVSCNVTTRPLPLRTLKTYPGNNSDIYLEWTVNPDSTQDRLLVTFWEINEYGMKESKLVVKISENNSNFFKFNENIRPGKRYILMVATVSGNISANQDLTRTVKTRPLPVNTLESYPGNNSNIRIEWTVSPISTQDSFIITYWEFNNYEQRESVRVINSTYMDINKLLPGRKYSVAVVAVSNDVSSHPKIVNVIIVSVTNFPKELIFQSESHNKLIMNIVLIIILIVTISIVCPILYIIYHKYPKCMKISNENLDDIEEMTKLNPTIDTNSDLGLDKSLIIDRKKLKLNGEIGKGQFGTVHFAIMTLQSGRVPIDVAIKTSNVMKNGKDMDLFLKEALIMKNFNHPNVLSLYGISFEPNGSPLVVLPFMKNRDVLKYIRNEQNQPTVKQLMGFAIDVAKGMDYLSKQHFIHRDLAARNCMLDNDLTIKVADFGLSKATKDYYKTENSKQMMPIKWMSIESLEKGIYDTKTDVWSYGVFVWELMTRGIIPYPNMHHFEVLPYLRNGYRLPKPNYCPDLVYDILLECWATNPKLRPAFESIVNKLEVVFDTLLNMSKSQSVEIENVTYYNHPVPNSTTII